MLLSTQFDSSRHAREGTFLIPFCSMMTVFFAHQISRWIPSLKYAAHSNMVYADEPQTLFATHTHTHITV